MADPIAEGPRIPNIHEVLIPISDEVEVDGLPPELLTFAAQLGYLHYLLLGLPLVITKAQSGDHVPGSTYRVLPSLMFRTNDKTDEEILVFLVILSFGAKHKNCRVFRDHLGAGEDYITVEYHGQ